VVNLTFAGVDLGPADVVSTWSGLRPLVWSSRGTPSEVPRHHRIQMTQPGWFDVTGGKLTTYRLMAEHVVNRLFEHLGRPLPPCPTALEPLIPQTDMSAGQSVLPPEPDELLVRRCCHEEWALHLEDVMVRRTSWAHYLADDGQLPRRVAQWMAGALGWSEVQMEGELRQYETSQTSRIACVRSSPEQSANASSS
jgi:glycerol-3-phosphate dehydrogenase